MVEGLKEFYVIEQQALEFVNRFQKLKKDRGDYHAMTFLFDSALDDENIYNLLLLNAWRSLMEASNILEKVES